MILYFTGTGNGLYVAETIDYGKKSVGRPHYHMENVLWTGYQKRPSLMRLPGVKYISAPSPPICSVAEHFGVFSSRCLTIGNLEETRD